jgi:hemerythrin-like domain-containing protein
MFSFLKGTSTKGLGFDSKLIKKLHKDHEKLLKNITKISEYLEADKEKKAKTLLKQLKTEILNHFMEEDIKLYRYMKKYYDKDKTNLNIVKNFEISLKTTQNDIIHFLDTYTQEEKVLDEDFKTNFNTIINNLNKRIETEEQSLYTLYIK